MNKEDLKVSFDKITPSESAKDRMLDNILNHSDRKMGIFMKSFNVRKAIPALALAVVITGGLLTYNALWGNRNNFAPPEYYIGDDAGRASEDMVAPLLNQFQIDGKHYIFLSDDLRADYGFPATVNASDIGEKITDIKTAADKSLIGSEVYSYIPAGGKAVVAVKKDNEYQLFRFFVFESYNNNQDEDSIEYLKIHGIDKADDIAKIQFIGYSEQSKLQGLMDIIGEITDRDEIARFYSYYSVLKNSSDKYFDRLFNYKGTNSGSKGIEIDPAAPDVAPPPDAIEPDMIAPDQTGYAEDLPMDTPADRDNIAKDLPLPRTDKGEAGAVSGGTPTGTRTPAAVVPADGMIDMGDTGSGETKSVQGSVGSAGEALANPITIRIYNQSGVYYDSAYYMNIGFISRYEVSEEFAKFMSKYIGK